jgi:hypothetical protein
MKHIELAVAMGLTTGIAWSCTDAPVDLDRSIGEPVLASGRSFAWSAPVTLGERVNSAATEPQWGTRGLRHVRRPESLHRRVHLGYP